jgi:MYXO-CTERM domain-containing protein
MRRMNRSCLAATSLAVGLLLWSGAAHAEVHALTATLEGAQEVPPVTTTATGSATLRYDDTTKKLTGTISFMGITSTVTAAHIHKAPAGEIGPPVITLGTTSPISVDATIADADEAALLAEGTYVNVHSSDHPGGEIRGQIVRAEEEEPDAGSSSGGTDSGTGSSGGPVTTPSDGGNVVDSGGNEGGPSAGADEGGCGCKAAGMGGRSNEAALAAFGLLVGLAGVTRRRRPRA